MKTINLSVQHPVECVTLASLDCMTESTETLCTFWRELNSVSVLCICCGFNFFLVSYFFKAASVIFTVF